MPAPGWKKKTKSPSGVGLTLVNRQKVVQKVDKNGDDGAGKDVIESVLETRDLDEVMEKAELAGRLFAVNNPLPQLLIDSEGDQFSPSSPAELEEMRQAEEARQSANLRIPRRPRWNPKMTAEELDVEERRAFLNWRRDLARLEGNEHLVMTPFEKNLDIWRQLWRVLERSDLTVMVVDSRNPLFYRCPDLESYVNELGHNKKVMLLLNKADLLTTSARREWAAYFKLQGLPFVFWSAKVAASVLEGKAGFSAENPNPNENVEASDDIYVLGREELLHRLEKEAEVIAELQDESSRASLSKHFKEGGSPDADEHGIRSGEEAATESRGNSGLPSRRRVVVGFVGYPNVGKSSTINALVGQKKTGVTSTPGKTKHFQTLIINEQLMLCDCPGLVFPSFSSSKSEMVASGVVPIDRLSDHRGPVQVVADTVSRTSLEEVYGISLPKPKPYEDQARPPSAAELLLILAASRGYFANSGLPDETRGARLILKDYLVGKLPYCYMPPADPHDGSTSQGVSNTGATEGDSHPRKDVSEEANARQEAMSSTSKNGNTGQELLESNRGTHRSSKDAKSGETPRNLLRVDHSSENLARVFADLDASGGMA